MKGLQQALDYNLIAVLNAVSVKMSFIDPAYKDLTYVLLEPVERRIVLRLAQHGFKHFLPLKFIFLKQSNFVLSG